MKAWEIGLAGEIRAARYAKRQGMRILKRRYRAAHGEIDLIAQEDETLVFIEVKTRSKGTIGDGSRAVDREKRQRIRRAAFCFVQEHPAAFIRFDVIEISAAGLRHLKNAF